MNRFRVLVSLLLMGGLLCGCFKVGPNFKSPGAPYQGSWIDQMDTSIEVEVTNDPLWNWWTVFHDPVLDSLIATSYEQNFDLQIACYRILEARARLGIAIGEFFPQTQELFGSAMRFRLSKNQANTLPFLDFRDYQLGFRVAWEVDFWGRFRRAIEAESASLYATIAEYDNVLTLLFSDVAEIYVQIRTVQGQIDIVRSNIKIQERGLEIAKAQFEGGFVSELDVQQATTLLRGTEARLPALEILLRQAQDALSVLLGIPPIDLENYLSDTFGAIPSTSSDILVTMPETLLYRLLSHSLQLIHCLLQLLLL